jgi:hypothetical protein
MNDPPQPIAELVDVLAAMPGTIAVVLGGSRALGANDAGSDWDLGLYYRGAIDLAALAARGVVYPPLRSSPNRVGEPPPVDRSRRRSARSAEGRDYALEMIWTGELNRPLKKTPGEGTGPTIHADFRGNLVGRVPPRGDQDVFEQAAKQATPVSYPN